MGGDDSSFQRASFTKFLNAHEELDTKATTQEGIEESPLPSYEELLKEIDQLEDAEEHAEGVFASCRAMTEPEPCASPEVLQSLPSYAALEMEEAAIPIGARVQVHSFTNSAEFNGMQGVVGGFSGAHVIVKFATGKRRVKPANLRLVVDDAPVYGGVARSVGAIPATEARGLEPKLRIDAGLEECLAAIDRDMREDDEAHSCRQAFLELGHFSEPPRNDWSDSEDEATPASGSTSHFEPPARRPPPGAQLSEDEDQWPEHARPPRFIQMSRASLEARRQRREDVRENAKKRYTEALTNAMYGGGNTRTITAGAGSAQANKAVAMPKSQSVGFQSSPAAMGFHLHD